MIIRIRKDATGEIREVKQQWGPPIGKFYFSDGSGACDCVRGDLFGEEAQCGTEMFSLELVVGDDVIYSELRSWDEEME